MRLKYLTIGVLLFSIALVSSAEARVTLDITGASFVQIPIVIPKWRSMDKPSSSYTGEVYNVLARDLSLSGFFRVIDYQTLPTHLRQKEGIPEVRSLQEWGDSGFEFMVAGEVLLDPGTNNLKVKVYVFDLVEQKDERNLKGKQYEGSIQNLRHIVHRVADDVVERITREKGVHTTRLAYVVETQPGLSKEIFVADFDGANARQITQNQSINLAPVWTPNGRQIAFTSYLKRNPDVYLIDTDGKNLQRFSAYPGLNVSPSWSPDGKKIALMLGLEGKSEIFLIDSTGGNPQKLTKGHGNEASPRWSPDGSRIAFVSDRSGSPQVYMMRSDGSEVKRVTFEGSYNTHPAWSPKGDQIAFCGRSGGRFHIFTVRTDGTGLRRLTSDSGNNEGPCWSPDGRYIAFSSTRTGPSKIFIMNANGFNQRPLTTSKAVESGPAWSRRFE